MIYLTTMDNNSKTNTTTNIKENTDNNQISAVVNTQDAKEKKEKTFDRISEIEKELDRIIAIHPNNDSACYII
jgi:hypothetical protein